MTSVPVGFELQRVPSDTSKSGGDVAASQVGHEIPQSFNAGNASTGVAPSKDEPNATLELDYPDGGLRAWLVVFGAFCASCATFGFTNSWGVLQSLYEKDILKGTSPSTIAWIGSTQYALLFLPGLLIGGLFDKGYYRGPQLISSCILVSSCFIIPECREFWQFFLVQGVLVGIACGCIAMPTLSAVTHWFKKRRSVAFGVTAVGSSLGGSAYPILIRTLERRVGFAWAMRIVGFTILALLAISSLCVRRRLPPSVAPRRHLSMEPLKNRAFSIYAVSSFFCFLGLYAALTYCDVAAISQGIDPSLTFYLVSVANLSSGVGRLLSGFLGDRFGPLNTMAPFTLLAAVMTFDWPFAKTFSSNVVVMVMYGFASGTYIALMGVPVAAMGEMGELGRRTGMMNTILAIGALAGPPASGAIASAAGSYVPLGAFSGSVVFIAVALMFCAKRAATGQWIGGKF